jgi:hypothetical protein
VEHRRVLKLNYLLIIDDGKGCDMKETYWTQPGSSNQTQFEEDKFVGCDQADMSAVHTERLIEG